MFGNTIKTGDYKGEKHVPTIKLLGDIKKGEPVDIEVKVGEEISHPNTPEHHIAWIELYFVDETGRAILIGRVAFTEHGGQGITVEPRAVFTAKFEKPGTLVALSYCNLHGVWENTLKIEF